MPLTGKLFNFFVYSNLFIAVCAILMVNQTTQVLLHEPPDFYLSSFVFFSTICSYSFHWYLETPSVLNSPRIEWQHRHHHLHLYLLIAGIVGSVVFFFYLYQHWHWLLFAAIITFLYSAPKIPHPYFRILRKVALGKTMFLALVWTFVTAVMPIIVSDKDWQTDFYLFILSRFFLIFPICILFDYRDRADDKLKGIRSLITWMDEKGIRAMFIISITIFFLSTLTLLLYHYSLLIVLLLLIPGIITAALFNKAERNFSDMLYYFVLDGLMALSSLLTLMVQI